MPKTCPECGHDLRLHVTGCRDCTVCKAEADAAAAGADRNELDNAIGDEYAAQYE